MAWFVVYLYNVLVTLIVQFKWWEPGNICKSQVKVCYKQQHRTGLLKVYPSMIFVIKAHCGTEYRSILSDICHFYTVGMWYHITF